VAVHHAILNWPPISVDNNTYHDHAGLHEALRPVGNDTGIHCRLAAVEDEVGTKKRIQTTARLQRLPESHVCNVRLRLAWTWTEHDAAVEEALRYRRSVRANLLSSPLQQWRRRGTCCSADPVDARHASHMPRCRPRTCAALHCSAASWLVRYHTTHDFTCLADDMPPCTMHHTRLCFALLRFPPTATGKGRSRSRHCSTCTNTHLYMCPS
jgi:hypothetical protein